jgi:uncharacterized transporter YbjL
MVIILPLLEIYFPTMFIAMFNPLRQIDKFNEMQLGMIAANRVLLLLIPQTRFKIQEPLKHPFSMVIFISRTSILATSLMKRL